MRKLIIFFLSFFSLITNIKAEEKIEVYFDSCIDGDTATVTLNNEKIKIRFLAIDTPESVHPTIGEEEYGKEASNYTCNALTKADKIEIEYDSNSDKLDKYNRHLVWVFVDNELLQHKLIKKGLAEVAYLYGDYKYTSILEASQLAAQTKQIGIWDNSIDYIKVVLGVLIIIIVIVLFVFNDKFRKKATKKIKTKAKKELEKLFKS